jgi:hypothetical protein
VDREKDNVRREERKQRPEEEDMNGLKKSYRCLMQAFIRMPTPLYLNNRYLYVPLFI